MLVRLLMTLFVGVVLGIPSALARADNVFLINGKERPERVVVTIGDTLDRPPERTSQMMGLLDGVIADLSGPALGPFLAMPMPRTKLVDARGNLDRIGVAHLIGAKTIKRVELFYGNEGIFLAQEMEPETPGGSPRVARLDPERARAIMLPWPRYRGVVERKESDAPVTPALGTLVELEKPYLQGPFFFDQATLNDRFMRGGKSQVPPVARVLADETMYVRLPSGYDPKRPAGLLVWISPALDGRLPPVFDAALDELGFIGVGMRNAGNDREVADRFQLAVDAAWTASRRFHVDPRRVYVTGMSGGGRVASRLIVCFPDFFTGAIPIVGLDTYFNVPVGNGRFAPGRYKRPDGATWVLAKKRPIASITGDGDGNAMSIREGSRQMAEDGLSMHVFDYKGFGHQMPSSQQFLDAMRWVDEPYQRLIAKDNEEARRALDTYIQRYGKRTPADERQRNELIRVSVEGPWTDAAWEAASLLRASQAK